MPRRQFVADLQKAQDGVKPPGINSIRAGEDDGQFEFEFNAQALDGATNAVNITAMIPDVSEYPAAHEYMIFCSDDAPPHIAQALQNIRNIGRKTVSQLIDVVSTCLSALALPSEDSDGDLIMGDSLSGSDEDQYEEDDDADDVYGDDDDAFSYGGPVPYAATAHLPTTPQGDTTTKGDKSFRDRIRADLIAAKDAGFKVGHLGSLMHGCSSFVTVSIRMSKLGISDEAMQAWKVDPSEHLILLIQYPNGYKTSEQLQAYDSLRLKPNIGMRVFAGRRYKPTLTEAINAFTTVRKDRSRTTGGVKTNGDAVAEESSIQDTFISSPLATLLEENLVPILRFRSMGMDWSGAEGWYNEMHNASSTADRDAIPDKYFEPEAVKKALPSIMHRDQFHQKKVAQYSFPLLAMQFALRHFVRCTEFCLVCHARLEHDLQAIKPYVCERPLCLFQYMNLGFGPSIEHEILAQPFVVDLLISFCYSSAKANKLKDFPDGLGLMLPPLKWQEVPQYDRYGVEKANAQVFREKHQHTSYEVGFDSERRELIFFEDKKPSGGCPVARGQWIVINFAPGTLDANSEELHCRVRETNYYPTISVDEPVVVSLAPVEIPNPNRGGNTKADKPATPALTPKWVSATFSIYDQEFEQLSSNEKGQAICKLLDTLPSVNEMRKYLSQNHPNNFKHWVQRMSRDATNLLRWIIASNRACIMQVENEESGKVNSHKEERLHGAEGYMQFRFAMGAPDKESRFVAEVHKTTDRLKLQYPTIFAWHGSPLHNWHMIIREGLHFKNTDHGRAYGHGVYHAKDATTSGGYAAMSYGAGSWMKSMLRVSSALALNEIVNAPGEFVSSNPYYVVPQLDWIQTRYLLVRCAPTDQKIKPGVEALPQHAHPQDPKHTPKGPDNKDIVIPASAIKSSRSGKETANTADKRRSTSGIANGASKKLKDGLGDSVATAIDLDEDDTESVMTDTEDLEILFPEAEPIADSVVDISKDQQKPNGKAKAANEPTTDFEAGTLDFSILPLMPVPTYATPATTKRLLSELSALSKIQSSTLSASLGWSIDTAKLDNVYQWIVELHSFHTFSIKNSPLPLVEDMKKSNATSIVLEIRFGPDFPFSPPYIRVIHPRFLPFTQGGGGHIVIGGAMCMELLTNSGWSSVMSMVSMESVLMQVRMAIASEPFARLEDKGKGGGGQSAAAAASYGVAEAAEGYIRACASHGWTVPPGFKEVAYGMGSSQVGAGAGSGASY